MKKCRKCGFELENTWECCPKCGENLKKCHLSSSLLLFLITIAITIIAIIGIIRDMPIFKSAIIINVCTVVLMIIVIALERVTSENKTINKVLRIIKFIIFYFDILVFCMISIVWVSFISYIFSLIGKWILSI